jgi:hypothetical protein
MNVSIKTQIWQNGDIFWENASAERRVSLLPQLDPAGKSFQDVRPPDAICISRRRPGVTLKRIYRE